MKNRDLSIDILRAIAIIFMVASHVVWIFDPGITGVWDYLRDIADNISFIIFLFAFGFGTFYSYLNKEHGSNQDKKHLNRIWSIVLIYIGLNLLTIFFDFIKYGFNDSVILNFILFKKIAGFTEFLIPFIIYGLLIISIKKLNKKYELKTTVYLSVFGILAYILGLIGYAYSSLIPEILSGFWSVLFGHKEFYVRFPVFQYLLVFVLGTLYAHYGSINPSNKTQFLLSIIIFGAFISLLGYLPEINQYLNTQRFPVNIGFIAQNLSVSLIILIIVQQISLRNDSRILDLLSVLGQSSLGVMFFHIFTLRVFEQINYPNNTGDYWVLIPLYFIALCSFFVYKYILSILDKKGSVPPKA